MRTVPPPYNTGDWSYGLEFPNDCSLFWVEEDGMYTRSQQALPSGPDPLSDLETGPSFIHYFQPSENDYYKYPRDVTGIF